MVLNFRLTYFSFFKDFKSIYYVFKAKLCKSRGRNIDPVTTNKLVSNALGFC